MCYVQRLLLPWVLESQYSFLVGGPKTTQGSLTPSFVLRWAAVEEGVAFCPPDSLGRFHGI